MPDGAQTLRLREDFPPVPTADWEAAIRRDLKGADYEKRLVWRSEEGVTVRPYYRAEDVAGLGSQPAMGQSWKPAQDVTPLPGAIRADWFHEAGASAVEELAFGIAAGVERLTEQPAARELEFIFAAGSTFFFEIAKLRAARWLWAQAVGAFGLQDDTSCRMRLHVRTSRLNKSIYDPYSNLLRVTTESFSAAIGGCDELTIEPFGFDPHLAVGVQRILREEAHVDAVADPAAGSYFVEALTESLAAQAWKLFQQVDAEGGYRRALESGSLAATLAATRAAREKAVASRRRTLVGVNNYPDLLEKVPDAAAPLPESGDPLPQARLAEPFERIRARSARHARRTGRYPQVLLLKRGDLKMSMARANFSLNFFGCAGFDIVPSSDYADQKADVIVLCSSDPEYLALAQEVCPRVTVPVIVAGNPKDQIEALQNAGVQGFVHVMSNAVETLTHWQDRLGMEA